MHLWINMYWCVILSTVIQCDCILFYSLHMVYKYLYHFISFLFPFHIAYEDMQIIQDFMYSPGIKTKFLGTMKQAQNTVGYSPNSKFTNVKMFYLIMPSVANIIQQWKQGKHKCSEEICPTVTLSTTNPTLRLTI